MKNLIVNINKNYTLELDSTSNQEPEMNLTNNRVFSRTTANSVKCNSCTKSAYYQDIEYIYYCWFHRSQYE